MSRWFRMYDELLDDPKVQRLSGDDFKAWVNVLCLASRNDGALPLLSDIAFALRIERRKAEAVIGRFVSAGLVDRDGDCLSPHGWGARQYKSDVSTGRVKQFRERKKAVAGNGDETFRATPPETDTETDITKDKSLVPAQRANRLPKDFQIPGDWVAWAMAEHGWSQRDALAEAASFVDYWHAKSGRDATKLDWQATWRNWCRNSRRVARQLQPAVPL